MLDQDTFQPDNQPLRVVVADDDRFIRAILHNRLTAMDCETYLAEDGSAAWQAICDVCPNLAFVDLSMPKVDGYEVIERIRAHPRTSHIPVIVITSHNDKEAIDRAFAAGATSFLSKPIRWSTFDAHIRYLLRLTQSAQNATSIARRAEASMGIKGAVFRRALAATVEGMSGIRLQIDTLHDAIGAGLPPAEVMQKLRELSDLTAPLEHQLRGAESLSHTLCRSVAADNRKVTLSRLLAVAEDRSRTAVGRTPDEVLIADGQEFFEVSCDLESLAVAIANLLDNAARHSPAEATITLEALVHEDYLLTIAVHDDGPGMYAEDLNVHLYPLTAHRRDLLERPETYGLKLSKAIAEAHGGSLEIRTSPGEGTTAMLTIPPDRVWIEDEAAA